MNICLPYGDTVIEATLDPAIHATTLDIPDTPPLGDLRDRLHDGLCQPIGMNLSLADQLPADATVAIVVSDSFRKTGVDQLLPGLLGYLLENGVHEERISFLFATGAHRAPTEKERSAILGAAVYKQFRGRAFAHDPGDRDNLIFKGETSRGTPVYVNRRAEDADFVLLTGTVVLHYFGGFGGGRKSVVPGIAGTDTIAANHALNLHPSENRLNPDVAIGRTAGNPVAEDMLEAAMRCGQFFLVNTVLNRRGAIAGLYCGDLAAAHDAACQFAREQFTVAIGEQADLTVASAGSAKNFVQSHKALYNAWQATKPGGVIVLLAPAPEGFGGDRFVEWLALGNFEAIIAELRKNAEINGQTALSTLEKSPNTLFVTGLSAEQVELLGGRKAGDLQSALATATAELAAKGIANPRCCVMPSAGATVPVLTQKHA